MLFVHSPRDLDSTSFHKLSNETLDELADFFEDLGDSGLCSKDYDVMFAVSDTIRFPNRGHLGAIIGEAVSFLEVQNFSQVESYPLPGTLCWVKLFFFSDLIWEG